MAEVADHESCIHDNNVTETDILQQPFSDPIPCIKPSPNFNDMVASEIAHKLHNTIVKPSDLTINDKQIIIDITTKFNQSQRMEIRGMYLKDIQRDLLKDLKLKLGGGKFERLCIPLWYSYGEYDALLIHSALEGIGFSTELLNEVILTRTDKQISSFKQEWNSIEINNSDHIHNNNDDKNRKSLVESVEYATKKYFSSDNNYQILLLELLNHPRPLSPPQQQQQKQEEKQKPISSESDKNEVTQDAKDLHNYLCCLNNDSQSFNDVKLNFVQIFSQRSWIQLRLISNIFQQISKKYTLSAAITKSFGSNSNTTKALCLLDEFVCRPYDVFAHKLKRALNGSCNLLGGINDDILIRIMVSRAEIDLVNIYNVFGQKYGNGRTLYSWIKESTDGDYQTLLLAICGFDTLLSKQK